MENNDQKNKILGALLPGTIGYSIQFISYHISGCYSQDFIVRHLSRSDFYSGSHYTCRAVFMDHATTQQRFMVRAIDAVSIILIIISIFLIYKLVQKLDLKLFSEKQANTTALPTKTSFSLTGAIIGFIVFIGILVFTNYYMKQ